MAEILRAYPELGELLKHGLPPEEVFAPGVEMLKIAQEVRVGAVLEQPGDEILERESRRTPSRN